MKKIILIGIGMALILLVAAAQAIQHPQQPPYIVCGHVYDGEGNLASGVEVTLTNVRTSEVQTIITNDAGEYLFECLNFKQEYKNKDILNINCIYGSQEVVVDIGYAAIQADINRPEGVPVEPIIAGTILVAAAGGAYFYLKKKKNSKNKNLGGGEKKK